MTEHRCKFLHFDKSFLHLPGMIGEMTSPGEQKSFSDRVLLIGSIRSEINGLDLIIINLSYIKIRV
jgi:hypothetical protein